MADQQNISSILAALAAQRPGGTPNQAPQPHLPTASYPSSYTTSTPPVGSSPYPLPQPISSGSVDLSSIKPVSSGSVSIADAIAKARGFAAERGVSYDSNRVPSRNDDPRRRSGRSRSPSRSPPRAIRDNFRDNYNPYRDERRGGNDRGYARERSFSPRPSGGFSPSQGRPYNFPDNRASMERGLADGDTERIPIEKSLVGLIIGRAGENLRRVEQTTGARVQFKDGPESGASVRNCDISGSRSARASAKAEIYRIIDENGPANRSAGPDRSKGQTKSASIAPQKDGDNGTQIMVPDRTVGLIIGRGGETIRDLQERSGCHVNIVGENKSVNGLRPVNLIGSDQSQQRAKDLIMEIVESDTRNAASKQDISRPMPRDDLYSSTSEKLNDSVTVPGDAVGMIIGKGGESIKEMQNTTGCKINVSQPTGRDIEREIGLVGTRHAVEMAKRTIMDKVDTVVCSEEGLKYPGKGDANGFGQDSRNRSQGRDNRLDDPYSGGGYPHVQQQPYSQSGPGPQQPAAPAAGEDDPYAAYGGYNNYVAMWYAAMAQQQQQQQGAGEQPGPPGAR